MRVKLGIVSKVCVGIAVVALGMWLMFATQGMPGRVARVYGQVHLSLYTHTVTLVRVTPIKVVAGRAQLPGSPFFTVRSVLSVPYAAVAGGAMLVPMADVLLASLRARRAADRSRKGLCTTCGYDLRATAGRCPECGASMPAHFA